MKVKINVNDRIDTKVLIDDHDISNRLTGVKVELDASCIPIVKLELMPDDIEIDGNFETVINENEGNRS